MKDSCSEEDLEVARLRNQIREEDYACKKRNQRTVRTSTKKILKSKREIKEKQYGAGQKSEKRERIRSRLIHSRKKN
jgi:hypothetical protein